MHIRHVTHRVIRTLVLLPALMGLAAAAAAAADIPEVRFTVDRFVVEGNNPFSERETQRTLEPFLGEHTGLVRLQEASAVLEKRLKDKGYTFNRVILPPQTLTDGAVRLKVLSVRLDQVTVEGNARFSETNVLASLPFLKGAASGKPAGRIRVEPVETRDTVAADPSLNAVEIARALQVANEHPAKKIAVFIRQGEAADTLDARVAVDEKRPYLAFSSFNNTGTPETGRTRLSVGLQHGNLFDLDHSLTLSYTTSPEYVSDVTQLGAFYRMPIYPLSMWVSAFYSYSSVEQGLVADVFDVSGAGNFAGISFERTLLPMGRYSHKLIAGIQDRLFENDTLFAGTRLGLDVRTTPVLLRYTGRLEKARSLGSFWMEYAVNTGLGSKNDDINYAVNRIGAEESWDALRYGGDLDLLLPKNWRLSARLLGQVSADPLVPGEQFGLGGMRSVRGYEEREIYADSGEQLNLEILTPPLFSNIRLAGFADAGWAHLQDPHPGRDGDEFIAGTGLGLRWYWKDWVSLSLDGAVALEDAVETESGDVKGNFNLFLRY